MIDAITEQDIRIRYSEMDYDRVLKPSSLLQFLQDVATENAEACGFGYHSIIKKNLAWFLLKYHMEFIDYPKGIYDLKIKTEPRGYNKLFAFRDFEIYHSNKLSARVCSMWGLVDIDNREMISPAEALSDNPYMKLHEKRENDMAYGKIKPLVNISKEKVFEIRFDDLDVNQHVNNANYIVWAFEPLDFDFRHAKILKTLDMVFKKEIKYGNRVLSQFEKDGNTTKHLLKNIDTNEDLCLIQAEWKNK